VLARVDPDNGVQELNENNNTSRPLSMQVGSATPDLFVDALQTTLTQSSPGQTVEVTRSVYNLGNAEAPAELRYTYFLSRNEVVSTADIPLGSARSLTAIKPGNANTATETVTLPGVCSDEAPSEPCVRPGIYWIGVCVDHDSAATPSGTLVEINEVNNCGALNDGLVIATSELSVLSSSVREVAQFAPTSIQLRAAGGDGTFVWSLAGGALPNGMLLKSSGELMGAASAAGTFAFDVKVVSGAATQTQAFSLTVVAANLSLTIADQQLPAAEFGLSYEDGVLVAIGGTPPYRWTLAKDSRLPTGLALSKEGRIEGRASEVRQQLPFMVELTDAAGVRAAKSLEISVLQPGTLQIATPGLSAGTLGLEYAQPLQALGGRGPYLWSVVSFQPLAEGLGGQPGQIIRDAFPQDFGIRLDKVGDTWSLRGVPARAGLFSITLKVLDSGTGSGDFTSFPLRVNADRALVITTTALPDAFVNQPYAAGLSHSGGSEAEVTFSNACVPQVNASMTKWGCAPAEPTQQLPAGIAINEKGELRGTPSSPPDFPANGTLTYAFLVKVEDQAGRQDLRSLSIKLRADFAQEKSGCSSVGGDPAILTLLALMGLGLRRSRRSCRSLRGSYR
ncbi:MAG: putative Ig domain-containing protein, partial [Myxococcaceae bacterium]